MAVKMLQVRIDEELLEWFDENFYHGARQVFVNACFSNLRKLMEEGKLPSFDQMATIAILQSIEV